MFFSPLEAAAAWCISTLTRASATPSSLDWSSAANCPTALWDPATLCNVEKVEGPRNPWATWIGWLPANFHTLQSRGPPHSATDFTSHNSISPQQRWTAILAGHGSISPISPQSSAKICYRHLAPSADIATFPNSCGQCWCPHHDLAAIGWHHKRAPIFNPMLVYSCQVSQLSGAQPNFVALLHSHHLRTIAWHCNSVPGALLIFSVEIMALSKPIQWIIHKHFDAIGWHGTSHKPSSTATWSWWCATSKFLQHCCPCTYSNVVLVVAIWRKSRSAISWHAYRDCHAPDSAVCSVKALPKQTRIAGTLN